VSVKNESNKEGSLSEEDLRREEDRAATEMNTTEKRENAPQNELRGKNPRRLSEVRRGKGLQLYKGTRTIEKQKVARGEERYERRKKRQWRNSSDTCLRAGPAYEG